jgi:hypothetical protein
VSDSVYIPLPGDIGLTQISGDVGRAIRIGQWLDGDGFADYEHAFVYTGQGRIIEAEPGGALDSPLSRYDPARVAWLRCPAAYRADVAQAARVYGPHPGTRGVPYSFADYAAIAAHRAHMPVPGLRSYIESTGHMICSQLADRAAMDGGWHLFDDGRWPGYITPGDIWRLYDQQVTARSEA